MDEKAERGQDSCHEQVDMERELETEPEGLRASLRGPSPRSARRPWSVFLVIMAGLTMVLLVASALSYFIVGSSAGSTALEPGATVYYNSACGDCVMYINMDLSPALNGAGVDRIVLKDWTNNVAYREELFRLHREYDVDTSLMSHLTTFVKRDGLIVFEGHVPPSLVAEALALNVTNLPRMVVSVWDDGMMGDPPVEYAIWAYVGEPQVYAMSTPAESYIDYLRSQQVDPYTPQSPDALMPLVIVAGFLDGLNPCAFAVLLFFVSFLYAIKAPAMDTAKMGSIYIYAIFIAYFLIGLGLLGAIVLSPDPHFMARVGAVLMIIVGGISILNYFLPKIPMPFHMPKATWEATKKWMKRATLPGTLVAGFLVGICTFPCSGTIYVFVLGLLASKTSFMAGLGYLYLYNVFFVLPLVITLGGIMAAQRVTERPAARRFAQWERAHSREFRLITGVVMVLIGIGFFVWALIAS